MGAIKGVAEVVINVHDIAGMQAFYERTLGFTFHSRFPDPDPTIVFLTVIDLHSPLGRGGHPQLFALVDPARHIPDTFVGLDVDRSSLNHLAFEIDETDFESELQRLKALGPETLGLDQGSLHFLARHKPGDCPFDKTIASEIVEHPLILRTPQQ